MALDGNVHIPGMGEIPKKGAVIGGAVIAGIVGVAYYRHRNASNATAATDTTGTTDTTTTGEIDPETGIPYADEINQNDSSGIDPSTGIPFIDEGSGGGGVTTTPTPTNQFADNSEWALQAEADLGGSTAAASAINKVLGGVAVTSAEKNIFMEAIGLEGQPPNGYPQPIKMLDTPQHPKKPVKKFVTADGHDDLNKIATENHTTEGEIVRLNLNLAHLVGTKKPVKKGTQVRVS